MPGGLGDYAICCGTQYTDYNGAIIEALRNSAAPKIPVMDPATGKSMNDTGDDVPNAVLVYSASVTRISRITDGTSNTILVGEKHKRRTTAEGTGGEDRSIFNGDTETGPGCREAGCQVDNRGVCISGSERPLVQFITDGVNASARFGSYHPGVCQFVMCDGSVKAIKSTIDVETLRRLAVRNDGLVVPDF